MQPAFTYLLVIQDFPNDWPLSQRRRTLVQEQNTKEKLAHKYNKSPQVQMFFASSKSKLKTALLHLPGKSDQLAPASNQYPYA